MHGSKGGGPIKHGRYSKYAPVRMLSKIEEALADPELMSMREQAAVLDAIAIQRIEALGADQPAHLWSAMALSIMGFPTILDKFRESIGPLADNELKDALAMLEEWHKGLERIVGNGIGIQQAESDLREIFQEQAKLSRVETARESALVQGVTARQLNVLLALILDSLRRNVEDDGIRRRIATDLLRAIGPGSSPGLGAGDERELVAA